ncbi:ABC transporter substrate-binding protein [Alkalicoccobacillus gibsonii]|uniref:ABC transporter substrate-binding protein n=1 Tax=Alkalicoccobacillus gibsonii TaxID=79881 RepID=UPI003F7CA36A
MMKGKAIIPLFASISLFLTACGDSTTDQNINEDTGKAANEQEKTTVTVEHLEGEMTFEEVPEDIVVLDVQFLDHLLALDKQPVGTVYASTDQALPEYLEDLPGDPELLGTYEEPNVELILSLTPDLIIATDAHEGIQDQLESIAPTLVFDRMEDWKTIQLKMGDILGKRDQAESTIAEYSEKVDALREELSQTMSEETVALIRPRDDMIRLHTTDHRTSEILYNDLGLKAPELAEEQPDTSSMISIEILPDLEADHFFLLQDATNEELTKEFMETSIWQGLKPVKEGQVYEKDTALWVGYYSPLALNIVVDQVAEELIENE